MMHCLSAADRQVRTSRQSYHSNSGCPSLFHDRGPPATDRPNDERNCEPAQSYMLEQTPCMYHTNVCVSPSNLSLLGGTPEFLTLLEQDIGFNVGFAAHDLFSTPSTSNHALQIFQDFIPETSTASLLEGSVIGGSTHMHQRHEKPNEVHLDPEFDELPKFRQKSSGRQIVTLNLLRSKFHLPISKAARELGMGVTVMKKYCRKFGIDRWPFRKLHSITKLISSVKHSNPAGKETLMSLIEEKKKIEKDPKVSMRHQTKKLRQSSFKERYKTKHGSTDTESKTSEKVAAASTAAAL